MYLPRNVSAAALNLHGDLENALSLDIQGFAKVSIPILYFKPPTPQLKTPEPLADIPHGVNCVRLLLRAEQILSSYM